MRAVQSLCEVLGCVVDVAQVAVGFWGGAIAGLLPEMGTGKVVQEKRWWYEME